MTWEQAKKIIASGFPHKVVEYLKSDGVWQDEFQYILDHEKRIADLKAKGLKWPSKEYLDSIEMQYEATVKLIKVAKNHLEK